MVQHTSIIGFWRRKVVSINPYPGAMKRLDDVWNHGVQNQPSEYQIHDPMIIQVTRSFLRLEGNRMDLAKGADA